MRIALDCRSVFPGHGGIGRYAKMLALWLSKIDSANEYFLFTTNKQQESLATGPNVKQVAFSAAMIDPFWEQIQLPGILQKLQIDLYHNPCFSVPIASDHCKRISTVHDVVFKEQPELVENNLCDYLDTWTQAAIMVSDKIITVSEYSKKCIAQFYHAKTDIIDVVYNGIEEKFQPASHLECQRVCKKYQLPEKFILYLGSIEAKKNIHNLLEAFKIFLEEFPHSFLVLAGGKSVYNVEEIIQQIGIEKSVILPGYIDEGDVVGLLTAANVFIYISLYEGFGLPPLEAMAVETPVIVSDQTSLPEIVADSALVVKAKNKEDIANGLKLLTTKEGKRKSLIDKGKNRVKFFSPAKCAKETLAIYHQVLGL